MPLGIEEVTGRLKRSANVVGEAFFSKWNQKGHFHIRILCLVLLYKKTFQSKEKKCFLYTPSWLKRELKTAHSSMR